MPSNAERYGCTPVTLALQSTAELLGAGPAENRVKEESPMNWGQSYCNMPPEVVVCACSVAAEAEMSETKSNARRIKTWVDLFCVKCAPEINGIGCLFYYKLYGKHLDAPNIDSNILCGDQNFFG
jgi:hypothetical protein